MGALLAGGAFLVVTILVLVIAIIGMWKTFSKAGQPGVAAIVPIWNTWVLVTGVAKKEPLWFVLMLIPLVNIVILFMVFAEVAKKFGRSGGFAAGLFFLPFIFWPILGFGGSEYEDNSRRRKRKAYRDDYEEDEEDERPRRKARRDDD